MDSQSADGFWMNGSFSDGLFVAINKPVGITSFSAVARIRRASGNIKTGHSGTLDPFANGLLILGIGRQATKLLGSYMLMEKEYSAEVAFGTTTDTGDPTGKIISQSSYSLPSIEQLQSTLHSFQGEIEQIPPAYSAIKIGGKRLYKSARKGESIIAPKRKVSIYKIELINTLPDGFNIRVVCSRGTYIRSLAVDICNRFGFDGHLRSLTRTRIGNITLEQAGTLESVCKYLSNLIVKN